jgi:hypothetical protein
MLKYKTKSNENIKKARKMLQDVYDLLEGDHSNIPGCCIEVFISGRTYKNFNDELSEKDQRKLDDWGYVPCDTCFKHNRKNKINLNGTSDCGMMLATIMQILKTKEKL